jgi:uncharacterized membrane protein YfcA
MMDIALLSLFAFAAGLIDAAVGGGGLIQIPALFNVLPTAAAGRVAGDQQTGVGLWHQLCRAFRSSARCSWTGLIVPAALSAFVMSFCGAATVSLVPASVMRPMVLAMIVLMWPCTPSARRTSVPCTSPPSLAARSNAWRC